MTIQPASPDSPPDPKKFTPITWVRYGTVAFFCVCVVIAWVAAANYDPAEHAAAQKVKPARVVATSAASTALLEESASPPPSATNTVIAEDGTLPLPPFSTQPAVTATSDSVPSTSSAPSGGNTGGSRDDPIPTGIPAEVGNGLVLAILTALSPADSIVLEADPFSLPLDPGYQYLQLEVRIICNQPAAGSCFFSPFELAAAGEDDFIYGAETMIEGIDEMLQEGDYPGGSAQTGLVFLIIPVDDPTLILYYLPFLFEADPIYFELP